MLNHTFMTQAYQLPHSLAGELLGARYAATLRALLLLPLPRDCPEPGRSEVHQADAAAAAAAASHSSHLSSPPALQSSDHSAAVVPETAATPPGEQGLSGNAWRCGHARCSMRSRDPEVPYAALSMAHGLPAPEGQPVMPAMAHDTTLASAQHPAALPVALPMEEERISQSSQHAGMEDVHEQGQHAIGTASASLPDRGIDGGRCSAGKDERQARCAVLVPCCEAVHGRFPLNGTYFQTNEVFLDASSLDRPIVVTHSGSPELRHPKPYMGSCV